MGDLWQRVIEIFRLELLLQLGTRHAARRRDWIGAGSSAASRQPAHEHPDLHRLGALYQRSARDGARRRRAIEVEGQIVTGVGFLGRNILQRGAVAPHERGAIWGLAAIGVALGAGSLRGSTVLQLIVLVCSRAWTPRDRGAKALDYEPHHVHARHDGAPPRISRSSFAAPVSRSSAIPDGARERGLVHRNELRGPAAADQVRSRLHHPSVRTSHRG